MSAAAATAEAAPPAKGKKKLIIILAVVLLLVAGGGGAAVFLMKKKAAEAAAAEAEDEDGGHASAKGKAKAEAKHDPAQPPVFLPLDPFVVNLADKDADRYAQIGVTLEVEDAKLGDQLKAYMPAIRNGILMVLAHKTSTELLTREGKEKLAGEIMRESVRPLGIELEEPEEDEPAADDEKPKKKKKKRKTAADESPVKHVHFSNFIIQ
ncbi:flagellar basal body-associated FliL family protein [Piscinibacter defluvii]|uniref:flagellar basal body-associated FliL family protein n=1 Tax=Piscinibacter defluvii TaxID=1796922 RepID=UPI000FDE06DF|nr:flagellar basal body-associated FliL family protein [Piscinibacter defluvii]